MTLGKHDQTTWKGVVTMDGTIQWYQSKAIWGSLLTVLASVFGLATTQDTINSVSDVIVLGATAIGGGMSLYGRVVATKQVTTSGMKKP